jgi:hypothetical protein
MQDPEVNDLSFDLDNRSITFDVRIVRNSECCGDECKEYTFNGDVELTNEIDGKIDEILKTNPEADFDVEEQSADQLEEGGGRYKKSYYGFTLVAGIKHGDTLLGTVTIEDKCAASEMDELA